MDKDKKISKLFDRFSCQVSRITGSSTAFICALLLIIAWAVTGPIFHFSDTWQLVINTGTTIITFLMVFVIQEAQNKDTMAVQLKLNELIAATKGASNTILNIEDMTEDELKVLKKFYSQISARAQKETEPGTSHSIDEAPKGSTFREI
jgi:low affinity Fe/Cu permease